MRTTENDNSTIIQISTSYAIFLKSIPLNFKDFDICWDNLLIDTDYKIVYYNTSLSREIFTREELIMILGIATLYQYQVRENPTI